MGKSFEKHLQHEEAFYKEIYFFLMKIYEKMTCAAAEFLML